MKDEEKCPYKLQLVRTKRKKESTKLHLPFRLLYNITGNISTSSFQSFIRALNYKGDISYE